MKRKSPAPLATSKVFLLPSTKKGVQHFQRNNEAYMKSVIWKTETESNSFSFAIFIESTLLKFG